MQTFLPYSDFKTSAMSLDSKRLGKQRVETLQIVKALTEPTYGWKNHPATKMWRGHIPMLVEYQRAICAEWGRRNYKDTCMDKTLLIAADYLDEEIVAPQWLGNPELHISHRSNLLRKNPEFYSPIFEADLNPDLEYVWPVQ